MNVHRNRFSRKMIDYLIGFTCAHIPCNTDCAEIVVLLLFCDADPTVMVPIGECGDKLGRAAAGGL